MEYQDYVKKILSDDEINKLLECYEKDSIKGLRVNLNKSDETTIGKYLNLNKHHPFVKEAYIFDSDLKLGKNPLHYAGAYYLQEPSAMMVAHLIGIEKDDKVLDLCAAPGGKSSQVLSYLNGSGVLVSNDISYKRAQILSENIERMGANNAYVLNEEVSNIEEKFYGFFDKVILDAPCSGMGMFRKNEDVYKDWTYNKTLSLSNTNKDLIIKAYNCLKKGGVLAYSTCTFANEENEEVIQYLLDNTSATVIKIPLNDSFYHSSIEGAIRLYPFKFEGEGHFICLIRCNDEHYSNINIYNKEAHRKEIELYRNFERENMNVKLEGKFIKMGDELHLLNKEYFSLNKLRVLRNGLHLGTIKKDRFEPNHALAMYLKKEDVKNIISYNHDDINAINYLKGFTLPSNYRKGYTLVCINDISVGWGKDDGKNIKNLYPKGLRMN